MSLEQVQYNPCNDYYRRLGVHSHATQEEILHAYRKAVKKHHPDVGGEPTGRKIKAIYEAYTVLGHPFKRSLYNCSRNRHGRPPFRPRLRQSSRHRRSPARRVAAAAALMVCITVGVFLVAVAVASVKETVSGPSFSREIENSRTAARTSRQRPGSHAGVLFRYASPLEAAATEPAACASPAQTEHSGTAGARAGCWD